MKLKVKEIKGKTTEEIEKIMQSKLEEPEWKKSGFSSEAEWMLFILENA